MFTSIPTILRPAAASFRVCRLDFFVIIILGEVLFRIVRNGAARIVSTGTVCKRCSRDFAGRCFEVICETTFIHVVVRASPRVRRRRVGRNLMRFVLNRPDYNNHIRINRLCI